MGTITLSPVRSDTLPENTRYHDDGCEVSSSCLACPLPVCKYDDPSWQLSETRRTRDDLIFSLRKKGVPVPELARQFSVSTRTVHRIIQRGGAAAGPAPDPDEGPLLSLEELARRSLFQKRTTYPSLQAPYARSA